MEESKKTKKYSEMTFEEFITDVLKIELSEDQLHMVKMFEEVKTKKVEYINNWLPRENDVFDKPLQPPTITYSKRDL